MSPLRLLILAALGYILYRLLFGRPSTPPSVSTPPGNQCNQVADDVLVEDPVCHTYIPRQGADSLTVGRETIYFCSPECRRRYQAGESS